MSKNGAASHASDLLYYAIHTDTGDTRYGGHLDANQFVAVTQTFSVASVGGVLELIDNTPGLIFFGFGSFPVPEPASLSLLTPGGITPSAAAPSN